MEKRWTLLPPRPVAWELKPLSSAPTHRLALQDGRLQLTIQHDLLEGVSLEMLHWWYGNIDGTMHYMGQEYPRYLVWHPLDHIQYRVVRRAPDGGVGPGARVHIVETFERNLDYLVDVEMEIEQRDRTRATVVKRAFGQPVMQLMNEFIPMKGATQVHTRFVIGLPALPGKLSLNGVLRSRLFPLAKGQAWLKHNVEKVGNLENFLPELYTKSNRRRKPR
jgi:hypothetical protein